jgi:hypothetical protein
MIDLNRIAMLYSSLPAFATAGGAALSPGMYLNVPESQYHAADAKSLVSNSALSAFSARSPMHYAWSLLQPPEPPTPAMALGTAAHVAILEGREAFDQRYVVLPDFGDMRSSTRRAERDEWISKSARDGKTPITKDDADTVWSMREAVMAHPIARKLLADGSPEVTAVWRDRQTGRPCKARADWLHKHDGLFVDLKTTDDASPETWARKAAGLRYHVADAFYSNGFDAVGAHIDTFAFLVVERDPPHGVAVYVLDDTARLKGEELYMRDLAALHECIETNRWPGYGGDKVQDLSLPAWATRTESV